MSGFSRLANDTIIDILDRMKWQDTYNFCLVNPDICEDKRIANYVTQRGLVMTNQLVDVITTIPNRTYGHKFLELGSLDENRVIIINHSYMDNESHYVLTEVNYVRTERPKFAVLWVQKDEIYKIKISESFEVGSERELKQTIIHLLFNGYIDETYKEISWDMYNRIIGKYDGKLSYERT